MNLFDYSNLKQDEFNALLKKYKMNDYYSERFSVMIDVTKIHDFKFIIHDNYTMMVYEYNSDEELIKAIKFNIRKERIDKLLK